MNGKSTNMKWFWVVIGICLVSWIVSLPINHSTRSITQPEPTSAETIRQPEADPVTGTTRDAISSLAKSALLEFETRLDLYKALCKQQRALAATLLSEHPEIPAAEEYLRQLTNAVIDNVDGLKELQALNEKNPVIYRSAQKYLTAYCISNALRSNQPVANTTISEMFATALSNAQITARVVHYFSDVTASTLGNGSQASAAAVLSSGTGILQVIDEAAVKHRSYFQKLLMDEGISDDSKATAYMETETQMCVMRQYISAYREQVSPEELLQVNRRIVDLGIRLGELMESALPNSEARARMLGLWNDLRNDPH